jgi:hypothetical protein
MTLVRTELALALDDMDENQDGVRFQRMALQLVRRTWPEIVSSEPGKDLGVDARVPASLAADGVGRAFACSITPTYAKILADARKIRANYPSLKVMIFATPEGVSNQRAEGWIQKLHRELGLELVIPLPRRLALAASGARERTGPPITPRLCRVKDAGVCRLVRRGGPCGA